MKVLFDHSFISKVSVALSVYLAFFNYFQCFNLTSVINYPGSLDLTENMKDKICYIWDESLIYQCDRLPAVVGRVGIYNKTYCIQMFTAFSKTSSSFTDSLLFRQPWLMISLFPIVSISR